MIIREDSELEKLVVDEQYHIALPFQIIAYPGGNTDYLVYSFCESLAESFEKTFPNPFDEQALLWLENQLHPIMNELGYETEDFEIRIHREYRITELPDTAEKSSLVELISVLTDEDRENGMQVLEEFVLEPDNPDDRMTVIRDNGRIIAFAAVNDMQEDSVIEITVECDEAYRRRGYGTACVSELARYFINHGREVKYLCDENNTASIATAEAAGFTLYSRVLPMVYYYKETIEE